MKKYIHSLMAAAALTALAVVTAGAADDAEAGRTLVEANCVGCHGEEVYTAADRKVSSLEALRQQVAACTSAAEVTWTDAQKANVTDYLNREYYRFE